MGRHHTTPHHTTLHKMSQCVMMVAKSGPNPPDCGQAGARLAWPAGSARHPPVQHWDLGRTQNVDVDVFSLESHCGYLCLSHFADCDVPDKVPHQGDPGPLQHGGGGEELGGGESNGVWSSLELR